MLRPRKPRHRAHRGPRVLLGVSIYVVDRRFRSCLQGARRFAAKAAERYQLELKLASWDGNVCRRPQRGPASQSWSASQRKLLLLATIVS